MLKEEEWPEQPSLKSSVEALHEEKPIRELVSFVVERHDDELDELLRQRTHWQTARITTWILRFVYNLRAKKNRGRWMKGKVLRIVRGADKGT